MAKLKFPQPASQKESVRAVLCTSERVVGLFNQATDGAAQNVSNKVRTWFKAAATENGWAGAFFLPEVQTGHAAGCILFKKPQVNVQITVHEQTLVLEPADEAAM